MPHLPHGASACLTTRRSCRVHRASWSPTRPGGAINAGRCGRQRDHALLGDAAAAPLAGQVAAGAHAPLGMVYRSKITTRGGEQALNLCSLEPDCRALWIVFIVMGGELGRL